MAIGGIDFNVAGLSGCMRQFVHAAAWKFAYLRAGGFCVVASAVACVDFFFDFVALRGCIGADVAFTVATIASYPSQPHSRAGSASTFANRWRGTAGDRPHGDNASTFAPRSRRGTAADRPGSGAGAGSRHTASDHPGHRTEVYADPGKTSAGKTSGASRGANGTQPAITLRDRRAQCGRRDARGATAGEPDDDLGRGPQCASDRAQS
jgi:hypothetical protein